MNESTIELIKVIKSKRKEKGLTQVELAKNAIFLNRRLVELKIFL